MDVEAVFSFFKAFELASDVNFFVFCLAHPDNSGNARAAVRVEDAHGEVGWGCFLRGFDHNELIVIVNKIIYSR